MKRPNAHLVDAAGERLLRGVLEPIGWSLNRTSGDYGIDFDVEVFRRNRSTGLFFKLQLKSSASSSYSRDRSFVAVTLAAQNARYLAFEVQVPTILVHADTAGQRLYWLAPQLGDIELSAPGQRRHMTVRIPTKHNLADTVEELLKAVVDAQMVLALRLFARAPRERVVSVVPPGRAREELLRDLHDNVAALRVDEARRLTREGDPSRARTLLIAIVRDGAASIRARFDALVALELAELRLLINSGAPDIERHKLEGAVARELVELTEDGPVHMRLYALLARAAADLNMVVRQEWGLYLIWHNHRLAGDAYYLATIAAQHAALAPVFERSYRRAMRLIRFAARSRYGGPQSNALIRIVNALLPLIEGLKGEGVVQAAAEHRKHAFAICQLAAALAKEVGDQRAEGLSAVTALLLVDTEDDDIATWARGVLDALTDSVVPPVPIIRETASLGRLV